MTKNPIAVTRNIIKYGTSIGAAGITASIIRCHVPLHPNPILRGCQYAGVFGIAGVVGDAASKYSVESFDEIVALITNTAKSN